MKKTVFVLAALATVVAGFEAGSLTPRGPTLVILNANVITMDKGMPRARAVAVFADRIAYVGENDEARGMAYADTEIVDLAGKTLLPGFNDNHTHTLGAGRFYLEPILWGLTCREIVEVVAREAAQKKPGETVTGNSWDYPTCPDPHKSMLDKAAPQNPVFLVQYSGHAAWVNSAMLKKLGIDRDTPDPEGGQIVRDENGDPTGILRDTAMGSSEYGQFLKALIKPSEHRRILDQALDLYRRAGITSAQDNTWEPFTVRLLNRYQNRGRLTCRFTCWPYGDPKAAAYALAFNSYDDKWVRKGPWKYYADGAFSTRTAWLYEPYADEPDNHGSPRYTPAELEKIIMDAARQKRQIAVHAIGDRAIHEVLDAIEAARAKYPWTGDLRFRLEHVQLMLPEDIARMKELGVVACIQPFTLSAPGKDVTLLGEERARRAYPFHSLLLAGVPVAFGSDVPAEVDYQPLLAIYYAVTRMSKDGREGPLNPAERFTVEEALYAYTMGSAYAEFMEDQKGSIVVGKLADLVALSDDPTAVPVESIKDLQVLMTIVGGKIVYSAPDFDRE